jgi:hypothetical protein
MNHASRPAHAAGSGAIRGAAPYGTAAARHARSRPCWLGRAVRFGGGRRDARTIHARSGAPVSGRARYPRRAEGFQDVGRRPSLS